MADKTFDVPYFRPSITEEEKSEVLACLDSGWLTTGPRTKQFEKEFAEKIGADHAIALNSCTAGMHLGVEALGLRPDQGVLVPTMTFAATAEVVRYMGAIPILIDCDPNTLNIDLNAAEQTIKKVRSAQTFLDHKIEIVGIMPVHVGGLMLNMSDVRQFAETHGLWVVEDAAHALPASYKTPQGKWVNCGEGTAEVTCYSFYANKTMTTGEGGMAVTNNYELSQRMRSMALHGLSVDAWKRFNGGSWDYRIIAPGYKYNMTDIAASIGLHQLKRLEQMREAREAIARNYITKLASLKCVRLPATSCERIHSWHLFPLQIETKELSADRNALIKYCKICGVATSVHWRPLHLHPYYQEAFGWKETDLPNATAVWKKLISLPIFPGMTDHEIDYTTTVVSKFCTNNAKDVA